MGCRFFAWLVSASLGIVATVAMLGSLSCMTHALVAPVAIAPALSSAAALGSVMLGCIFVGGVGVAVRVCALGLAMSMLAAHAWLSAASAQDLASLADTLMASALLPARAALSPGEEWDCVFLGPADALYMLSAMRHAAAVLAGMRQQLAAASGLLLAGMPPAIGAAGPLR